MAIANIITLGFGPGASGLRFMPTLGFGTVATAVTPAVVGDTVDFPLAVTAADEFTVIAGTTKRWALTALKDGAAWNLTGATVTLILRRPDGTETTYSAAGFVGANARYHDNAAADLPVAAVGLWTRAWNVVKGNVRERSKAIPFQVLKSP